MHLLAYLTKDARIVGLHISAERIVLAWDTPHADPHTTVPELGFIALPEGTIVRGEVRDSATLTQALKTLRARCPASACIVALPHEVVFTRTLVFPTKLSSDTVRESLELAKEWRIPFDPQHAYADTEIRTQETGSAAFLAAGDTALLNPYYTALVTAGFEPIAAESSLVSLARALTNAETTFYSELETPESISFIATKAGALIHAHILPKKQLAKKVEREREKTRFIGFIEALTGDKPVVRTQATLPLSEDVARIISESDTEIDIRPVLGALMRARVPRSVDTYASVLPLGTELAYEFQKLDAFVRLLATIGMIAASIAALGFGAAWYTVRQARANLPTDIRDIRAVDPRLLANRSDAMQQFDTLVDTLGANAGAEVSYARIITLLRTHQNSGIVLSRVFIDTGSEIRLAGVASSRAHLNAFRDALAAGEGVITVDAPITGADLRENIPFSLTLHLNAEHLTRRSQITTQ